MKKVRWMWWHSLSLVIIVVAIGLLSRFVPPKIAFLLTIILLSLFTGIAGHGVVGLWRGALIDERNRLSLARLQMILWTIVILSGFLIMALWKIFKGGDLSDLSIQSQLLMLMGISATSLVGSPLILSTKTAELANPDAPAPSPAKVEEAGMTKEGLNQQGLPPENVVTRGNIVAWRWPEDSRLVDIFQGDEIGNASQLDLGKIQMFFFTMILVFSYIVLLTQQFSAWDFKGLPNLSNGMITLLGISHAGFLANKAVPHSVDK